MLHSLHISNYILIDSLDIEFPGGLVIITGQTGAGKSILLGALSLLTGARADASVIRSGADTCVVEAEFDVDDAAVRDILEQEADVEWDGGHLTVRRVVYASGRSRSFVNDSPVQLQLLSAISSRLVDVHSQHQSLLLTDRGYQLSVLDAFAGNSALRESVSSRWRSLQALRSELSSLQESLDRMEEEREYTQARFAQLDAARLKAGELEALEEEQRLLASAEELGELISALRELDSPQREDVPGVSASLKEAGRLLDKISRFLPAATALSSRLDSVRLEAEDIFSEIESLGSRVECSPARLEAVEERMSQLYELMRRFSCSSVDELIARRDELSGLLFNSGALQERKAYLEAQISSLTHELEADVAELHESRARAAVPFAATVTESLHYLELEKAVFEISLGDAPMSAKGRDTVSFLFDAAGLKPVDAASCASGGELSRIMLCLKSLMAGYTQMPTMIFDEIDSGVSGSVADRMGSMICDMGTRMQVIAITHLPQVAAKGTEHFLVSKTVTDGGAGSSIRRITGQERIMEIARMLSGASVTPEAIANAESLLKG